MLLNSGLSACLLTIKHAASQRIDCHWHHWWKISIKPLFWLSACCVHLKGAVPHTVAARALMWRLLTARVLKWCIYIYLSYNIYKKHNTLYFFKHMLYKVRFFFEFIIFSKKKEEKKNKNKIKFRKLKIA